MRGFSESISYFESARFQFVMLGGTMNNVPIGRFPDIDTTNIRAIIRFIGAFRMVLLIDLGIILIRTIIGLGL